MGNWQYMGNNGEASTSWDIKNPTPAQIKKYKKELNKRYQSLSESTKNQINKKYDERTK